MVKKYVAKDVARKKRIHRAVAVVVIIVFIIAGLTACIAYDIGPMNELSCIYFNAENPTYNEMIDFIIRDITNYNEYTSEYKCGHFARDVIINARAEGMQAGFVSMEGQVTSHALVAFKTKEQGIYFLEPQTDGIFHITQMEHYIKAGRYYIESKTGYFDLEINRYSIFWFYGIYPAVRT